MGARHESEGCNARLLRFSSESFLQSARGAMPISFILAGWALEAGLAAVFHLGERMTRLT